MGGPSTANANLSPVWENYCLKSTEVVRKPESARSRRDIAPFQTLPPAPYDACEKVATSVSSLSLVRYRLNDIRHKLDKLVTEAVAKGLHLKQETQEGISALTDAHSEFWHRYPKAEGLTQFFTIEQFASSVAASRSTLTPPSSSCLTETGRSIFLPKRFFNVTAFTAQTTLN